MRISPALTEYLNTFLGQSWLCKRNLRRKDTNFTLMAEPRILESGRMEFFPHEHKGMLC